MTDYKCKKLINVYPINHSLTLDGYEALSSSGWRLWDPAQKIMEWKAVYWAWWHKVIQYVILPLSQIVLKIPEVLRLAALAKSSESLRTRNSPLLATGIVGTASNRGKSEQCPHWHQYPKYILHLTINHHQPMHPLDMLTHRPIFPHHRSAIQAIRLNPRSVLLFTSSTACVPSDV